MHEHPLRTLLTLFLLLLVIIGIAYAAFIWSSGPQSAPVPSETTLVPAAFPPEAPAPTAADYVTAQHGFDYLVSYNGGTFVPAALTVKKGETVRFTDNADNQLRLLFENAQVTSLNRGEYYEYTFANTGTFTYSDGTNTKVAVTVK